MNYTTTPNKYIRINYMRKTDISINIELDENHVPEKMNWNAPDGGVNNEETKAMLLSVWDDKAKEALRIDLWTKDMTQDDMKRFFHQIFVSMSSTYQRATDEDDVAEKIAAFAEEFAYASKIKG